MTSTAFGPDNQGAQVGVNNGTMYLSKEPEARPGPLWTVPVPRDPDFVGRDEILDQIQQKASAGSRVALVGLGGVGKTQLAIEYCHRIRQESAETWVIWVHASNAARCEKSLRDLADRTKIPGRKDHSTNIFQLVGNWLQDEPAKWLLVLDNIDDDELLRKPSTISTERPGNKWDNAADQPPLKYLFAIANTNGSTILTSRNRGVALEIVTQTNLIDVLPMKQNEALDLLHKKLDKPTEPEQMEHLAKELERIPLAITQATSYIVRRRCSISQYLVKLQESDHKAVQILSEEASLLYRDWEAKNSVLLTWQLSFDYIRKIRPSATDLLSLMSFFDRQGIPAGLLQFQRKPHSEGTETIPSEQDTDSNSDSDSQSDADHDDDLLILGDFSLILAREKNRTFTMHRLVQLSVRTWLKLNNQLEQWRGVFIHNLHSEFPSTGRYDNWGKCLSLFPHVKSAISHRPKPQKSLLQWATILYRGSWYAKESGNYLEAMGLASKSREYRLKILGEECKEYLESSSMLAMAYNLQGWWDKAEELNLQILEIEKIKIGTDHPDTLNSMNNLASTYRKQGRFEEAEKLKVQVLEIRKIKLGIGHPHTLASMNNLALTYSSQGRFKEAEKLVGQVFEASKIKLGIDHPDTLRSMNNLASIYWKQGRFQEALKLEVQALETRKTKQGTDHPDTLLSTHNLASTLRSAGEHSEAICLLRTCVAKEKGVLGPNHYRTQAHVETLLKWEASHSAGIS